MFETYETLTTETDREIELLILWDTLEQDNALESQLDTVDKGYEFNGVHYE